MRKPTWKKADAEKTIRTIAASVAQAFSVPEPVCFVPDHLTPRDWEWRFDTVEVWTKAGRAELRIGISDHFAHMYFRFDDPARASRDIFLGYWDGTRLLNRYSGKWNSLESAPHSLWLWEGELSDDFERVAEPNPPADEVAAYRAKEAARAAQWNAYLSTVLVA